MNKLKQYEQLIANKLQQVPLPDEEDAWLQMQKLLDEQDPPESGTPWWKWASLTAVIITASLWWLSEVNKSGTVSSNGNNPTVNNAHKLNTAIEANQNKKANQSINATSTTLPTTVNSITNKTTATDKSVQSDKTDATTFNKNATVKIKTNISSNGLKIESTVGSSVSAEVVNKNGSNKDVVLTKPGKAVETLPFLDKSGISTKKSPYAHSVKTYKNQQLEFNSNDNKKVGTLSFKKTSSSQKKNIAVAEDNSNPIFSSSEKKSVKSIIIDSFLEYNAELINKQTERLQFINQLNNVSANLPIGNTEQALNAGFDIDSVIARQQQQLVQSMAKTKDLEKLIRKTERRDRLRDRFSIEFKPFSLKPEGQPWWAAGLAINNLGTTGSQSRFNYNINAKPGLALDYLPSPYVQYHINDNVYLQTEINLSAPQHIPSILTTKNSFLMNGANIERSIFVQKLYYFNWPFSLHYSPVNNLYVGAGVQFSSLQSGVSVVQERNLTNNTLFNNKVLKFKDDSTAAGFRPNEWRWQAGADYYWNRFTLGMRYNQAFNKLVINNSFAQPSYTNNSLLMFIRYNLFEGRRKQ